MREIKYRGKAVMSIEDLDNMSFDHDDGWFIGNLIVNNGEPWIVGDLMEVDQDYIVHEFWVKVDPDSVGQYTGSKDKNGCKEIYEGDVYQYNVQTPVAGYAFESNHTAEVTYDDGAFWVGDYLLIDAIENDDESEIIGNKFEHPELLEDNT